MKMIGLLGGMSWESTISYYRAINESIKARLGGLHSARILLYSVDFHEIERLQRVGDWNSAAQLLATAARALEIGGANFLVICANTMHKVLPTVEAAVGIPLLHIADPTAERIKAGGLSQVGLLGTRFTMEEGFLKGRLSNRYGLKVLVPEQRDRDTIDRVIFEELCLGEIREESRQEFVRIIADLVRQGAQGVILGCTEFALLIGPSDAQVPLFDTAHLHALRAVEWALSERKPGEHR